MDSNGPNKSNNKSEDAVSRILLIVGLLLVVGAIAVYHFSPRFVPPQQSAPAATRVAADENPSDATADVPAIRGTAAPAFELANLDGKTLRMADLKGKVVLVNFWATWCGPCLLEIPWFVEFQKEYGPKGLEIVGVSMDEEGPSVVKPFVAKHEMNYTVVMGTDKTPELFGGLPGYPVSFLIDRQGKFYSKHLGLVSKEDIESEIQALLKDNAGKTEPTPISSGPQDASGSTPRG